MRRQTGQRHERRQPARRSLSVRISQCHPYLQVFHELLEGELEGALPLVHPRSEGEQGVLRLRRGLPDLQDEHGLGTRTAGAAGEGSDGNKSRKRL